MFTQSAMTKFVAACKAIESDPNYQPSVSNEQLMSLVCSDGNSRHAPRKSALAIKPFTSHACKEEASKLNAYYQVNIAMKSCVDEADDFPVWHVESLVLLVDKEGRISTHSLEKAKAGNFAEPLVNNPLHYLNAECLHPQTPKVEMKKSAS